MKAIIGITIDTADDRSLSTPGAYMTAVERSGGVPVIIPYCENDETIKSIVDVCDGFVFSGGADIAPARYGEEAVAECGRAELLRDELELRLFDEIVKAKKPLLAICRGCQFINVALGGTLWQDIPSQLSREIIHTQAEPKFAHSHFVNVKEGSFLHDMMGVGRIRANSFHHQAIKALGDGLEVVATADDGVIEAVYYTGDQYIRGYQWHPERICEIDEYHQRIFDELIMYCKK